MGVRIEQFGGMMPKLDDAKLPAGAAARALNCDVTRGSLRPLRVTGPATLMYDDDGLIGAIPPDEVTYIAQPSTPQLLELTRKTNPASWLQVAAHYYYLYVDSGIYQVEHVGPISMPMAGFEWTENGFTTAHTLAPQTFTAFKDIPYTILAPRYQFYFGSGLNGPLTPGYQPELASDGMPVFPPFAVPLEDSDQNIYANLECFDVAGPLFDNEILVQDYAYVNYAWPKTTAAVIFKWNMNYAQPRRRHYYFCTTYVDSRDREGPPSEISERLTIPPGMEARLSIGSAMKTRIYRSSAADYTGFAMVDEGQGSVYVERGRPERVERLPLWGNPPQNSAPFPGGNLLHPGGFGVAVWENTLRYSDVQRLHAWPKDFSRGFNEPIIALALTGNTVLVFAGRLVYATSGNSPNGMAVHQLTPSAPLLNIRGLCRLGNTVLWPTDDGLAAASGGRVDVITGEHFTRRQWQAYRPEEMLAFTADGAVYLQTADDLPNLRIDMEEGIARVSLYDSFAGAAYTWVSPQYVHDRSIAYDFAQVQADGPVTVNGVLMAPGKPVPFQPVPSHHWQFTFTGTAEVQSFQAFARRVITVGDMARLTGDDTPLFRNIQLRFPDGGVWACVMLSAQGSVPSMTLSASGVLETVPLADGVVLLPRTLPRRSVWTADVDTDVAIDDLTLWARTTHPAQAVQGGYVIREMNPGTVPPWWYKDYLFPERTPLRAVTVNSPAPVPMNLYLDGATTPITVVVDGSSALSLPTCSSVGFDFGGADADVSMVTITCGDAEALGPDGLTLIDPSSTRGLRYRFASPVAPRAFVVGATTYTGVILTISVDGKPVYSDAVKDGAPVALPRDTPEGLLWEVDLDPGKGRVELFVLKPLTRVPGTEILRVLAHDGPIPPWMYTQWLFNTPTAPGSFRIMAAEKTTIRIYADGGVSPVETATVPEQNDHYYRETVFTTDLAGVQRAQAWEFGFGKDNTKVRDAVIYMRRVEPIGPDGVHLRSPASTRYMTFTMPEPWRMAAIYVRCQQTEEDVSEVTTQTGGVGTIEEPFWARTTGQTAPRVRVWVHYWNSVSEHYEWRIVRDQRHAIDRAITIPYWAKHGQRWVVDIDGEQIDEVIAVPWQVIRAHDVVHWSNDGPIAPWRYQLVEMDTPALPGSVRLRSRVDSVVMSIYENGQEEDARTFTVSSGKEQNLASTAKEVRRFAVGFGASDQDVEEVQLYIARQQMMSGIVERQNAPNYLGLLYNWPAPVELAVAQVAGTEQPEGSLTLTIGDGAQTFYTESVSSRTPYPLPRDITVSLGIVVDVVTEKSVVELLRLYPREIAAVSGDLIHVTRQKQRVAPWLYARYEMENRAELTSVRVLGVPANTSMLVYVDAAVAPSTTIAVHHGVEVAVYGLGLCNTLEFRFVDAQGDPCDDLATEVFAMFQPEVLTPEPVVLQNPLAVRRIRRRFPDRGEYACVVVSADDYRGMSLRATPNTGQAVEVDIKGSWVHPLPMSGPGQQWELDLITPATRPVDVQSLAVMPWRESAVASAIQLVRGGGIPPWWFTEFVFPESTTLGSARVAGPADCTLHVYADGATTPVTLRQLGSEYERAFEDAPVATRVRLRLDPSPDVTAVSVWAREEIPIAQSGIIIRNAAPGWAWQNKVLRFAETGRIAVLRVVAESRDWPITLALHTMDGALAWSAEVLNDDAVEVPDLGNQAAWQLRVGPRCVPREVHAWSATPTEFDGYSVRITRAQNPWTWLARRVLAPRAMTFVYARVLADAYPVKLRLAGAAGERIEAVAHDAELFVLPVMSPTREWVYSVTGAPVTQVHEVALATHAARIGR